MPDAYKNVGIYVSNGFETGFISDEKCQTTTRDMSQAFVFQNSTHAANMFYRRLHEIGRLTANNPIKATFFILKWMENSDTSTYLGVDWEGIDDHGFPN